MPSVTRDRLIEVLRQALRDAEEVDAAWEGGSAAFSAVDAWSDVDVVAVVDDAASGRVFERVEHALAALSPIALQVEMPGTAGYLQRFYRLRDAGEFLVVDLVLLRRSDPLLFREVELHGHGRTWFDRGDRLAETHVDRARDHADAQARVPVLGRFFEMFQHVVKKERLRGRAVEALVFYHAMTLRPLAEALRLWHAPTRRAFGLRYLARDLPAPVCRRLERLAFVRDLADLEAKHAEACAWFAEVHAALGRSGAGGGG